MTIAPAEPADAPALVVLIERAYRGETARTGWSHEADLLDGQRTDLDALESLLTAPNARVLTMIERHVPIGCVSIEDRGAGLVYLGLLTIAPERQAAGLGRALLDAAERAASAFGARRIEMTVIAQRGPLIDWYQRRGYALTGERRPFPYGDARYGIPLTDVLEFIVLEKAI